jgi:hypothetical protein
VAWAALSARTRAPRSKFSKFSPNFAQFRHTYHRRAARVAYTDPPRVRDGSGIVHNLLGHPGTSHKARYHLFTPGYCSHTHFAKISRDDGGYAAQTNAQLSPTQHDPARPSTTQHGSARFRTTQHGPEPLRVAPDLAGRQIKLLQISPNFATHLIACMMAKPSCLSTLTCSDMPQ